MNHTHRNATIAAGALLVGAILSAAAPGRGGTATASSRGKVGYSGNPATSNGQTCSRCHNGGTAPEVTIEGPSLAAPGVTYPITLVVRGGQSAGAGMGASASSGLLSVRDGDADVQLVNGEITHTAPKSVDELGRALFRFLWRAPDAPGAATIYAVGNSVDLNGSTSGDAASSRALAIAVGSEQTPPAPGETPSPTATPAGATVTPEPSATPTWATVIDGLNNPHGLQTVEMMTVLVSEGGTGDPVAGQFAPGNGDGRVLEVGPTGRRTILDGMTNAQDPGGGIVGANHAIRVPLPISAGQGTHYTLVAQSGGPGQLRPAEAAKIIKVTAAGTATVLADTLAFETANNPGGETGVDAIDSNPWRLRQHGDRVYIADAGANDVLAMDPSDGALALFAVMAPIGDSQAVSTGIAFLGDVAYVGLLGPLGSAEPEAQIRRLEDANGDGDALDEGENSLFVDGLRTVTDLAPGPFGDLYVLEMGPGALGRIDPACWRPGVPCPTSARRVVATGLTAASAIAWDDNFDALVTTGPVNPSGPSLRTDRVVRVPYSVIAPEPSPTDTPEAPEAHRAYMPFAVRNTDLGARSP